MIILEINTMSTNWDKAKQVARDVFEKFSNDGSSINAFEVAKSEGISGIVAQPNP